MRIQFIKAMETWPLRHKVLRPHGTLEDCDFPNDRNPESFHLAAFEGERIVCVASFYREDSPGSKGWKQYRLRGMATDPELRGQGVGSLLLRFAMDHLQALKADLLWCNARENALPFYMKLGFTVHGDAFEIPGIGPHFLLSIKL
jgi:GNAT superfamily N-acetyltransferase